MFRTKRREKTSEKRSKTKKKYPFDLEEKREGRYLCPLMIKGTEDERDNPHFPANVKREKGLKAPQNGQIS